MDGVELEPLIAGVDDVVLRPGGDEHREARANRSSDAIENGLPDAGLHTEELVSGTNTDGSGEQIWLAAGDGTSSLRRGALPTADLRPVFTARIDGDPHVEHQRRVS